MNRQYSRDGLLKQYQNEANDNRERKLYEKQIRQQEERKVIDSLNRELELEKQAAQNLKNHRMNQGLQDYNQMINRKYEEKDTTRGRKDYMGTFKIGSENREIKVKTYDEVSNKMVLNPTREYLNNDIRGKDLRLNNEQMMTNRGKSQGYNIINHAVSQEKIPTPYKQAYARQEENTMKTYENYAYRPEENNNMKPYENKNDNHYYYNQGYEENNNNPNISSEPKAEYDEAEFQKYYEDYIKRKAMEDNNEAPQYQNHQNQNEELSNSNKIPNSIPTTMEEYEAYRNMQLNSEIDAYNNTNPKVNEIEYGMNNLNIKDEQQNEYQRNKNRNNQNNFSHMKENYYTGNEMTMQNNARKQQEQDTYRNYLDTQVKVRTNAPESNLERKKYVRKDYSVASNPYSSKNYEFGGTSLNHNPITNPVNSYQFNYNSFRGGQRETASARMRQVGNNIMK